MFGAGVSQQAGQQARALSIRKALLVTDAGLVETGIPQKIAAALEEAGVRHVLFSDVQSNPTAGQVAAGRDVYQREGCDGLVAVGGGSAMDLAKSVGVLVTHGGRITDYEGAGKVTQPIPPLIAIPTTCGTGSEVTVYSVITDEARKYKLTVVSPLLCPKMALVDPELLAGLPARLTAATGVDALTHAIESYTNLVVDPLSEALNLRVMELVAENLRPAVANGDPNALAGMALASTMAGVSLSNTRQGLCHAMAHPVGGYAGVHHGVANAILLPHVMQFNLIGNPEKYANIAAAMGEPVDDLSVMEAAEISVDAVRRLTYDVGIPQTLREVGVTDDMIAPMAEDAMLSGNIRINPRRVTVEDVIAVYQQAIGG
jgi:alcohol dehydrogenase class IV